MKTKTLLACGAVSDLLFVLVFLVEGVTRARYDPLRHPVSSLTLGDWGWVQSANFIVAGLLTLAFAVGLRLALRPEKGSTWGPLLVGVWAVSLLGAGVFPTDPVSGYPSGTPDVSPYSWHGALHDLFSLPGFVALGAACLVFCRRFAARGEVEWAIYSAVTGVVFAVAFVLASAGFGQAEGLVELAAQTGAGGDSRLESGSLCASRIASHTQAMYPTKAPLCARWRRGWRRRNPRGLRVTFFSPRRSCVTTPWAGIISRRKAVREGRSRRVAEAEAREGYS